MPLPNGRNCSMRFKTALAVLPVAAGLVALGAEVMSPANAQTGKGWTVLVDGKTMSDALTPTGEVNWRIEGGALVGDKGKGGHLVTKEKYKDFELVVEFHAMSDTNSGIFFRCADPKRIGAVSCYEANIWDTRKDTTYGTGAIVNFAEVNPMPKAGGKWNTMRIVAKGRDISVWLNGRRTVKLRNGMFEEAGHITLQYGGPGPNGGGGPIKFRKAQIRPL